MEAALIELQSRIAFQEESIQELSCTVVRQQRELDLLREVLVKLQQQVRTLEPSPLIAGASEPELPPHY